MAGSNFSDEVRSVLSDTMNLPADFLNYQLQYQIQNPVQVPKASGQRIATSTVTSAVTATGTTFATGTDVLSSAIEFTAQGNNDYIVRLLAPSWFNNTGADGCQINLNLDSADGGRMANMTSGAANELQNCSGVGYITKPSAGEHSVNVRLLAVTGGTAAINGGAGGVGAQGPIVVTLEVA